MKTFIVILIATLSAAVGEVLLSYGMRRHGEIDLMEPSHWIDMITAVVRNPYVLAGVVLLAVYFFLYLAALSWGDISYVMPLTAMSFVFVALMAKFALHENISIYRWAGTILIVVGISLVVFENSWGKTAMYGDPPVSEEGQKTAVGSETDK
jgi:drug/metabolite transporter (DMT)-like permease